MSNEFRNFKNKATDQVVYLPAHYGDLFPESLEPTDEDVECVTCNTPDPEEVAIAEEPVEQSDEVPTSLSITEPAKRTRRNSDS